MQLRQSLTDGEHKTFNAFCNPEEDNEEYAYDNGIPDFDLPESMYMDEDVPLHNDKVRQTSNMIVFHISKINRGILFDCLFLDLYPA
jgi:hypothetical protein